MVYTSLFTFTLPPIRLAYTRSDHNTLVHIQTHRVWCLLSKVCTYSCNLSFLNVSNGLLRIINFRKEGGESETISISICLISYPRWRASNYCNFRGPRWLAVTFQDAARYEYTRTYRRILKREDKGGKIRYATYGAHTHRRRRRRAKKNRPFRLIWEAIPLLQ